MSASSTRFRTATPGRALRAALLVAAAGSAAALGAPGDPLPSCRRVLPEAGRSIRWIAPGDAGSLSALRRWCASVGPIVFDPRPAGPPASIADSLTIVSWNVHVGAGDVDGVVARLRRGDFTGGQPVRQFVLLLQEAFRAGDDVPSVLPRGFHPPSRIAPSPSGRPREDVHALEADRAWTVFYVPSMRNGGIARPVEDRGNAIVSTLALEDPAAIELPLERQRRVAVAATIRGRTSDGASWALRIIDVHLDTALAILRGGPFAARRRQAEALVSATAGDAEALVAGDLNTWRGSREAALAVLRQAFPLSDLAGLPPQARPTFVGPLGWHPVLDHVFARGVRSLRVRRLDDRFGSDHYPLLIEVRF